jgi:capsular exopolysaccharide synthesis family protein
LEIKEYLRIFARYWWVIVLLTAVGAAIGWGTWQFTDREYQSTATLFVATQNGTTVTEAYQNNLFSQERVVSYAGLASSEQVAARAVDQLKAPISSEELRSKISAAPVPQTVLLNVSVTDADPTQAQTYANAVADQLVGLVSELETSRRGGTPAAGAVVVDEAAFPTSPLGLGMLLRIGLGAGGGLVVGIIVAILIGVLDKRVRGREPVENVSGSLVIGALPLDASREKVDVADLASDDLYAERLRELRTNLRFVAPANGDDAPRVIAVTSPRRQEGRTTTAIDLAAALAESGRSVVLVDGDLRKPELADRLPLNGPMRDGANARGLTTVLVGENSLIESVISDVSVGHHTIALLPAGPSAPRPGELWASQRAEKLFDELANGYDYVVIDTPPLDVYNDAAVVGALSDGALLLARIRKTTTSALRRAVQALQTANVAVIGTVVTFEPGNQRRLRRDRKDGAAAAPGGDRSARSANPTAGRAADADADTTTIKQNGLVGSAGSPRPARRHGAG